MATIGLEPWRDIWRRGIAPGLSADQLRLLADALRRDDPLLIQGAITRDAGRCLIGFCGLCDPAEALDDDTFEIEGYFSRFTCRVNLRLAGNGVATSFVHWYDYAPRYDMIVALLPEVERSLALLAEPFGEGRHPELEASQG